MFQSTSHGDKTLSQLVDVVDSGGLIHTLLHDWPDGIVNRVEVRWVRWPRAWSNGSLVEYCDAVAQSTTCFRNFVHFQQDSAPAHRARDTIQLLHSVWSVVFWFCTVVCLHAQGEVRHFGTWSAQFIDVVQNYRNRLIIPKIIAKSLLKWSEWTLAMTSWSWWQHYNRPGYFFYLW